MVLQSEELYSTNQKRALQYGVSNNIEISDIKNPGCPANLMEVYIECRAAGYDIEDLEDCGIGLLSLTYLDCIRELIHNGFDINNLISNGRFINFNNRQILTITDGIVNHPNVNYKLLLHPELDWSKIRKIIQDIA